MIPWLLQNLSSLYSKESVVRTEITDSGKLFQALIISVQKSISLNHDNIYSWLALSYAPPPACSTILMLFKAEDNITARKGSVKERVINRFVGLNLGGRSAWQITAWLDMAGISSAQLTLR